MRISYADITAVLETDLERNVVTALIEDASAWVTEHLDGLLAEATLLSVEKYLAAHLVVMAGEGGEGAMTQSTRGDVSERYAERKDDVSTYLRIAASFDSTGKVREDWMGGKRVTFRVGSGYADA